MAVRRRLWPPPGGKGEGGDETDRLRAALAAAEAANEAKTRFLASAAHEIRAPLNAIYGYAQLLERGGADDPLGAARVIRRSAEHLANLVEGLLDIAQVEAGALRLEREAIRFRAFLDQLIAMLALQAQAKGITLALQCTTSLPEFVHADARRLRQVLINLITNAIKFTDRGGVRLEVAYRNELATFSVIDTGIGIAPEDQQRIFAPFERARGIGAERAGAGLGLAITRALVQMMGGEITLESTPGVGTRFAVRLMLSQPLTPPADPPLEPDAVTGYRGRERWVLVVDDDPAQLALLRSLLAPLGFQVRTASDSETALALAAAVQPDLVLCDLALGRESGRELAAELRRRHGAAIRIVMLSGEAGAAASGTASPESGLAPIDAFIAKPFVFARLLDVIAAELGLEWLRAGPPTAAEAAPGPVRPPLPPALAARARPHLEAINRALRIGHVRGIEAEIDALAALGPETGALAEEMRAMLDSFDLKALGALTRAVGGDAG